MKKMMAFAAAILLATLMHAQRQNDVPAFGKVEKADLEMKQCEFDKNAEAMVLFDVGELYCTITGMTSLELKNT